MRGVASAAAAPARRPPPSPLRAVYYHHQPTHDRPPPPPLTPARGTPRLGPRRDRAPLRDVATRFMGQGWNVTRVGDANDLELVHRALELFRHEDQRPSLIIVDSHIGYGAPEVQDTEKAHGEPLGEENVRAAKRSYGWPQD